MATAATGLALLAFLTEEASIAAVHAHMKAAGGAYDVQKGAASEAVRYLAENPPPAVLIVEVPDAKSAPTLLDALADVVNPSTRVIITGAIDTFSFYTWLRDIGITDYLLQPFTDGQLQALLAKPASAASGAKEEAEKKLIAVIGARGGVGTTMMAIHLAAIFAKELAMPTALFDADAHFGSVALDFDLEVNRGLSDALEKPDRVDALFLERVMVKPFANLGILAAEEVLHQLVTIQPSAAEALISEMHALFPTIVVDLPRQITPLSQYILAQADHTILVAAPSLLNLRDTLRLRDYLVDTLKRPAPHAIMNQMGNVEKFELPMKEFEKHFGEAPYAKIPYIADAFDAMNKGELMLEHAKGSALCDPLRELARKIAGKPIKAEKKSAAGTKKNATTSVLQHPALQNLLKKVKK